MRRGCSGADVQGIALLSPRHTAEEYWNLPWSSGSSKRLLRPLSAYCHTPHIKRAIGIYWYYFEMILHTTHTRLEKECQSRTFVIFKSTDSGRHAGHRLCVRPVVNRVTTNDLLEHFDVCVSLGGNIKSCQTVVTSSSDLAGSLSWQLPAKYGASR